MFCIEQAITNNPEKGLKTLGGEQRNIVIVNYTFYCSFFLLVLTCFCSYPVFLKTLFEFIVTHKGIFLQKDHYQLLLDNPNPGRIV
jgi:hypothetical protein